MTDPERVRRGYDELAEEYACRRTLGDRGHRILDAFVDSLGDSVRVLDAGCGQGDPVLSRLSEAAAAVGLDFSRAQLDIATDRAPAAALVHGDMTALPFADESFDAVVAVDAVIHVPRDDHQTVLDEFARVLAPGGRVLLTEAPERFDRSNPDWLGSGVEMEWSMAGADATRRHLRNAGFRVTREWPAPDTPREDGPQPPYFAATLAE